jgi:hypothetical protein
MGLVNRDTILVRDRDLFSTSVDGDIVVFSVQAGAYFSLNRIGTQIWNMLAEPQNVGQILDALARLYDADGETVARDVTPFLQSLINHHLLCVVEPEEAK